MSRAPLLFPRPPRDDGPALQRAHTVAALRHRDGRDYTTFQLAGAPPAAPPAPAALFPLEELAGPDRGPAPLPGQLYLGDETP